MIVDFISAVLIFIFGCIAAFCFLTLLRLHKHGMRMADTTLRSRFDGKAWFTGSLPKPGYHPSYLTQTGMRARATEDGLVIIETRTLSRLEF
jgi:hypothetical protein